MDISARNASVRCRVHVSPVGSSFARYVYPPSLFFNYLRVYPCLHPVLSPDELLATRGLWVAGLRVTRLSSLYSLFVSYYVLMLAIS